MVFVLFSFLFSHAVFFLLCFHSLAIVVLVLPAGLLIVCFVARAFVFFVFYCFDAGKNAVTFKQ